MSYGNTIYQQLNIMYVYTYIHMYNIKYYTCMFVYLTSRVYVCETFKVYSFVDACIVKFEWNGENSLYYNLSCN